MNNHYSKIWATSNAREKNYVAVAEKDSSSAKVERIKRSRSYLLLIFEELGVLTAGICRFQD